LPASKQIRNLKKKVRQSDELQQKVSSGELQPNDEQKEKLASRGKLEGEIAVLEKELAAM
jgi:partner of Y14 and mago protein